ncbi:unnamed protein product [Pneumocystis jirovecii]|uniref:Uncharacterized protein n=1 Tax=Pneumocystis jirovecii TaxID=42068 RepID=L0PGS6_PNEJI|nr:unnamed protein product [Pneumocystis jirovecii]
MKIEEFKLENKRFLERLISAVVGGERTIAGISLVPKNSTSGLRFIYILTRIKRVFVFCICYASIYTIYYVKVVPNTLELKNNYSFILLIVINDKFFTSKK